MLQCLIAVGANLGDRPETIRRAVSLLRKNAQFGSLAHSAWHETIPVGGPAGQPSFLNGVIRVATTLSPAQVLAELLVIELQLGRDRSLRWGARTIDLDLLLYDEVVVSSPELTLPHPRMAFRRFVIEPAVEIAPEMRHPQIGWTIRQLYEHLLRATPYVAITGAAGVGKSRLAAQLTAARGARNIEDPAAELLSRPAGGASGPHSPRQIEWLWRREPLLRRTAWTDPARLTVSDFWLEQSLAHAAVAEGSEAPSAVVEQDRLEELTELTSAWGQARERVVPPKLLVVLDPSSHADLAIQRKLVELCAQPGLGPVLRLTSADSLANLAEATAAIDAMS